MRSVIIFLLLSCPAWATWTLRAHQQAGSCAGSVSVCSATVTNPTAGDLLVGVVMGPGASITLTSIACGTDILGSANTAGAEAVFTGSAYKLSAAGDTGTTCTATLSANPGGTWVTIIEQWTPSSGPAVFDTQASRDQNVVTTTPVAPTITLTSGANNVILETINGSTENGLSGGCSGGTGYTPLDGLGSRILAFCKNSNDATAPTWTTSANAKCLLYAIAFKETVAGGGSSLAPHRGVVF